MPRWLFVGALGRQLVNVTSTALIQVPIQRRLDRLGFDPALLDRLISTDLLFRKLPSLIEGLLILFALWSVRSKQANRPV